MDPSDLCKHLNVSEALMGKKKEKDPWDVVKEWWAVSACPTALEALVKYGATKSEYDEIRKAMGIKNESNRRRVKKDK